MNAMNVEVTIRPPALDLAHLASIAAAKPELMRRILKAYVDTSPGTVESLVRAFDAMDADRIKFDAHTLKGSSKTIGGTILGDLCQELEANPDREHLERVVMEFERLMSEIRAYLVDHS